MLKSAYFLHSSVLEDTALIYLLWEEKQINNKLTAITYGSGIFILLSNTGKCFKSTDNGNLWEESIIAEDNFSCITYNNNKFIAGTVSGKIYISEDYCKSWRKVCEYSSPLKSAGFSDNISLRESFPFSCT